MLSTADKLTKARIHVMRDPTFCVFSAVLTCGDVTLDPTIPTACTDGWNLRFSPTFIESLTEPQLRFVVLHEAMHAAYQHLHVWRALWERDPQRTNLAADHFVNLALVQADAGRGFIAMPSVGVQPDPAFAGLSVGQIFDRLAGDPAASGAGAGAAGSGLDTHDWETAGQRSAQERAEQDAAIQRAVRQGEITRMRLARGRGAGASDGVLGELLAPRLDWRRLLREFLSETTRGHDASTWRRVNRRYLDGGLLMPSTETQQPGEIVIGFDTSGSCFGTREMTAFASEVRGLIEQLMPLRVHVVYWDTRVTGHQTFEGGQFAVADLKPKGGGGTDGSVLFDYLRSKRINPAAVVQLTDGEVGDWGRSDWPTLWVITTQARAPYGTTVHIEV